MTTENTENTTVEIAEETMLGDLMKCIVDELRDTQKPWQEMSEEAQQQTIYRVEMRVRSNVRQAVEIIASNDRPTICATVEQVTVKDGIKAVLTLPKSDAQRHELFDSAGQPVLIIVASSDQYAGGSEDVKPDPNQRDLGIDEAA